ncbi:Crp/Fnr family transcriptional regulator [Aestuariivirga sp.]|uniref:Crp/Fnr family transcriptional regulator n=1 Tax=Aestuariivirga sp. TaxID=2650926 RepID=UPI0037831351
MADTITASAHAATVHAAARKSAWLSHQEPAVRERILSNSRIVKFSRGERIIRLDQKGSNLYFLFEGAVQVLVPRGDLDVVQAHLVSPFEWFGEYGAFTKRNNIAEYRARIPSSALVVLQSRLAALEGDNDFCRAATDLIADSFKRSIDLFAGFTSLKGDERVRMKLHALAGSRRSAESEERKIVVSQDELAAMSCVSRSVVSKVLSELSNEGTIIAEYRGVVVLHREKLLRE